MAERTSFDLTFTFDSNQVVRVNVDYEEGQAFSAINALKQVGETEYLQGLFSTLRNDPSVAEALEAAGLGFTDDEGTW